MQDWQSVLRSAFDQRMGFQMALEFEGTQPVPEWAGKGLDCRICMVLRGPDEEAYRIRTDKADTMERISLMTIGTECIALPDAYYAHSDHDAMEKVLYASALEARLPKDDYERLGVVAWANAAAQAEAANAG